MKLENTKELEELVKLCRRLGVASIEVDGVKIALNDAPKRKRTKKYESEQEIQNPDELTPEQLMYWSSEPRDG